MARFEYFVVFAEMRTGSNLLEASLNALDGVSCHGELFNHHFVGQPGKDRAFGVSLADRDAEPIGLLTAMRHADRDLPGFRFFTTTIRASRIMHCAIPNAPRLS